MMNYKKFEIKQNYFFEFRMELLSIKLCVILSEASPIDFFYLICALLALLYFLCYNDICSYSIFWGAPYKVSHSTPLKTILAFYYIR